MTRTHLPAHASALLALLVGVGCARIPSDRYGIDRVRIEGMEEASETALRGCLASASRPRVGLTLGLFEPGDCGEPPFDRDPPRVNLWAWPWTDFRLYDRVLLEQDVARVERWYQARGYHGARVTEVSVEPAQALESDSLPPEEDDPGCDRRGLSQGCLVDIAIAVEEGAPTLVTDIAVEGLDALEPDLAGRVRAAVTLEVGEHFDEAIYEQSKQAMREVLGRRGYARAEVRGVARVDRPSRRARVAFHVVPGPVCEFGEITVEGAGELPEAPIRDAVLVSPGERFDRAALVDAQRAIYALGSFSAVAVDPVLPEEGQVVDVRVRVTPARRSRFELGLGVQGGELEGDNRSESVRQWDLHLLGRYRHKDLFGGLRQLLLEERPRLIFQQPFPQPDQPRFGNSIRVELRQPGFPEPRTQLVIGATHTFGPDPLDVFFRHRVDSNVGLERVFVRGKLFGSASVRNSIYRVPPGETTRDGGPPTADSELTFLEQNVRLDLRDDPQRPRQGLMLSVLVHEAGYFLPSSWDYVRVLPDLRLYAPLPLGMTLAGRFALGMLFLSRADSDQDEDSRALGQRDYRLRGGGASSDRGYLPGRLGDGEEGGTRRWEASLELRLPVTPHLGVVTFFDAGDVSRDTRFRFDRPQAASGFGLRYLTLVGPIRLDFAWKIRGLTTRGVDDRVVDLDAAGNPLSRGGHFVFHITIGEAF